MDHLAEALFFQPCILVAVATTLNHLGDRSLDVSFILDIDALVELPVCVLFELVRDFGYLQELLAVAQVIVKLVELPQLLGVFPDFLMSVVFRYNNIGGLLGLNSIKSPLQVTDRL